VVGCAKTTWPLVWRWQHTQAAKTWIRCMNTLDDRRNRQLITACTNGPRQNVSLHAKIKATPPRHAHHLRLAGMQGNTLPNPSTIQTYFAPEARLLLKNSCTATSAVSRWVDGVATQFAALTKGHARWRDSRRSVHGDDARVLCTLRTVRIIHRYLSPTVNSVSYSLHASRIDHIAISRA
jgi:hypothetical protein